MLEYHKFKTHIKICFTKNTCQYSNTLTTPILEFLWQKPRNNKYSIFCQEKAKEYQEWGNTHLFCLILFWFISSPYIDAGSWNINMISWSINSWGGDILRISSNIFIRSFSHTNYNRKCTDCDKKSSGLWVRISSHEEQKANI